jgi:hypothetical protein
MYLQEKVDAWGCNVCNWHRNECQMKLCFDSLMCQAVTPKAVTPKVQ